MKKSGKTDQETGSWNLAFFFPILKWHFSLQPMAEGLLHTNGDLLALLPIFA